MKIHRTLFQTTVAVVCAWQAGGIAAQTTHAGAKPASSGLEEVTVTARKQAENLQRTPVAVTAISADDLANAKVDNITDIQTKTPEPDFVSVAQ